MSQVSVTTTLYAIYLSNYLAVMPAEVKTHLLEQANLNSLATALNCRQFRSIDSEQTLYYNCFPAHVWFYSFYMYTNHLIHLTQDDPQYINIDGHSS